MLKAPFLLYRPLTRLPSSFARFSSFELCVKLSSLATVLTIPCMYGAVTSLCHSWVLLEDKVNSNFQCVPVCVCASWYTVYAGRARHKILYRILKLNFDFGSLEQKPSCVCVWVIENRYHISYWRFDLDACVFVCECVRVCVSHWAHVMWAYAYVRLVIYGRNRLMDLHTLIVSGNKSYICAIFETVWQK